MAVRKVRCPQCGENALWAPENPDRPFCSSRCKQIDLGCWASDEYRSPVVPDDQDSSSEIPGATSHA